MAVIVPTPRLWSNKELRKVLQHLPRSRRVINVSGWRDRDKEGGFYRDYFAPEERYDISNYEADEARGGSQGTIALDLMGPLPANLRGSYDVAFSHTVLEHVVDPLFAFKQIADLSSDLVITVVPFKQKLHFEPGQYGDYFRMTPFSMRHFHEAAGLTVLYESFTPTPALDVYLFYVGSRTPERHAAFPRNVPAIESLNYAVGSFRASDLLRNIVSRFTEKYLGGRGDPD